MDNFEEWFSEVVLIAEEYGLRVLVERAPFMYEDYHEEGKTPYQAFEAEWL